MRYKFYCPSNCNANRNIVQSLHAIYYSVLHVVLLQIHDSFIPSFTVGLVFLALLPSLLSSVCSLTFHCAHSALREHNSCKVNYFKLISL